MKSKLEKIIKKLSEFIAEDNIKLNEPLSVHTSFKIGGPCDLMIEPTNKNEIIKTLKLLKKHEIPIFVLGRGSNIIVSDKGIKGAVVKLSEKFSQITIKGSKLISESGALLKDVSTLAKDMGLSGLEFACGIPGNIGGAVTMNAGAYLGEMKDVISSVTLLDENYKEITLENKEMDFGYRSSIVQKKNYIVLSASFDLTPKSSEEIKKLMDEYDKKRAEKQPLDMPSAGSIFKRPEGYYAGALIDECGLRGLSYRGAKVSDKHCGFIVNCGGATSEDVMTLIDIVKKTVFDKKNVMLEREVKFID